MGCKMFAGTSIKMSKDKAERINPKPTVNVSNHHPLSVL